MHSYTLLRRMIVIVLENVMCIEVTDYDQNYVYFVQVLHVRCPKRCLTQTWNFLQGQNVCEWLKLSDTGCPLTCFKIPKF